MKDHSIRILIRSVLVLVFLILTRDICAGIVRSIKTDEKKMNRINLKMGQSTVLRFSNDRPKKVVIGNQNYYNVEFVEGTNDVTLQPLHAVPTNLFVYCEKNNYGFLINTRNYGHYDDLVNIYHKRPKTSLKVRGKIIVLDNKRVKRLKKVLTVGKGLTVDNIAITTFKRKKTVIVDFEIKNTGIDNIDLKNLIVTATRRNKSLRNQTFVLNKEKLRKGENTKVRLIIKLNVSRGFTVNIGLEKETSKFIVSKLKWSS
jgi:hypothetical protein